ncbi:MAG TPA: DUF2384 domain-containing protein [Hyphomicrobiales bacterium]|nr:DUF2384 domain-containing protein [Kaistiaceae bacterium]HQF30593.1 DUF2384 domain-containing protein [Hyphomicrobiales bacterium]
MPSSASNPDQKAVESAVVTKAVTRTSNILGLSNRQLAGILGLSEPTISRMQNGQYGLKPGDKAFELGLLLVRLFRSLDAIVGGDEAVARSWLRGFNSVLDGRPIDRLDTITGLVEILGYLDARRARI